MVRPWERQFPRSPGCTPTLTTMYSSRSIESNLASFYLIRKTAKTVFIKVEKSDWFLPVKRVFVCYKFQLVGFLYSFKYLIFGGFFLCCPNIEKVEQSSYSLSFETENQMFLEECLVIAHDCIYTFIREFFIKQLISFSLACSHYGFGLIITLKNLLLH